MALPRFRIRPAAAADGPAAAAVVRTVFEEYGFTWAPETYHRDLFDLAGVYLTGPNGFWVAEDAGGHVVGVIGLHVFAPVPGVPGTLWHGAKLPRVAGADCELNRLYVVPEARRHGLGRALSLEVIAAAKAGGCRMMEIWSDKRFTEAHRLYERIGAVRIGDRVCDDPDESPEWGMVLKL